MESPVIRDISESEDVSPQTAVLAEPGAESAAPRSSRRFAFDPASAPLLVAALAWNTARPVR